MGEGNSDQRLKLMRERLRSTIEGHGGYKTISKLTDIPVNTLSNDVRGVVAEPPASRLIRVADACGVSPVWLMALDEPASETGAFREDDVAVWKGVVRGFTAQPESGRGYWKVTNRALELAGVLPGDLVEFDLGRAPSRGDVVVAQLYADDGLSARTVLRLFNPPFLTVHTLDPEVDATPIAIDPTGEKVVIMGCFARLVRVALP